MGSRRAGPLIARVAPASGPPAGRDRYRSAPLTRFDPQLEGLATAGPSLHSGACVAPGPAWGALTFRYAALGKKAGIARDVELCTTPAQSAAICDLN